MEAKIVIDYAFGATFFVVEVFEEVALEEVALEEDAFLVVVLTVFFSFEDTFSIFVV